MGEPGAGCQSGPVSVPGRTSISRLRSDKPTRIGSHRSHHHRSRRDRTGRRRPNRALRPLTRSRSRTWSRALRPGYGPGVGAGSLICAGSLIWSRSLGPGRKPGVSAGRGQRGLIRCPHDGRARRQVVRRAGRRDGFAMGEGPGLAAAARAHQDKRHAQAEGRCGTAGKRRGPAVMHTIPWSARRPIAHGPPIMERGEATSQEAVTSLRRTRAEKSGKGDSSYPGCLIGEGGS